MAFQLGCVPFPGSCHRHGHAKRVCSRAASLVRMVALRPGVSTNTRVGSSQAIKSLCSKLKSPQDRVLFNMSVTVEVGLLSDPTATVETHTRQDKQVLRSRSKPLACFCQQGFQTKTRKLVCYSLQLAATAADSSSLGWMLASPAQHSTGGTDRSIAKNGSNSMLRCCALFKHPLVRRTLGHDRSIATNSSKSAIIGLDQLGILQLILSPLSQCQRLHHSRSRPIHRHKSQGQRRACVLGICCTFFSWSCTALLSPP